MELLVIVPTFNEAQNIEALIGALFSLGLDLGVLVVDDDSPDGTGNLAAAMAQDHGRLFVLRREGRRGLGSAYVEGFTWGLAKTSARFLAQMDADFSHDPQALPALLATAKEGAVAVGSRYAPGGRVVNWGLGRRLLSRGGNLYARAFLGLPVKDLTGGFKCWPREVLEGMEFRRLVSNGYAFQVEMNWLAWRKGARLREAPITFLDRRVGRSKMTLGIGLEAASLVLTLGWQRLRRRSRLG